MKYEKKLRKKWIIKLTNIESHITDEIISQWKKNK